LQAQELIRANSAAEVEKLDNLQTEVKEYQECIVQMRGILDAIQKQVDRLGTMVGNTETIHIREPQVVEDPDARQIYEYPIDEIRQIKEAVQKLCDESKQLDQDALLEQIRESIQIIDEEALLNQLKELTQEAAVSQVEPASIKELTVAISALQGQISYLASKSQESVNTADTTNNTSSKNSNFDTTEQQKQLEEHVHKESVKVYRNVQAVVIEETGKVVESETEQYKKLKRKVGAVLVFTLIALLMSMISAAGVGYFVLQSLNLL
jgi:hypothetical protein